jgi:hypothetical protein
MNAKLLEQIAVAILYEGYVLYPYRATSKKNSRERFTFGRIYPEAYSASQNGVEVCVFETECLVNITGASPELLVEARFLQPVAREIAALDMPSSDETVEPLFKTVPELRLGNELFQPWLEAVERRIPAQVSLGASASRQRVEQPFSFGPTRDLQPLNHPANNSGAVILRRHDAIEGLLDVRTHCLAAGLFKVTMRITNRTPVTREELARPEVISMRTFASTHITLCAREAEFISLLDPPDEYKEAAAQCRNVGLWPVLVGDEGRRERDMMLASPIILYDYPKIAPESAGPLFDGTEIDEILTLRILTMTDEEKLEMRHVDELTRRLLERTETLPQKDLLTMHGVMRTTPSPGGADFPDFFGDHKPLESVSFGANLLHAGDRVRIRPKARADVMDIALSGKTAVVQAIEQDLENRIHLALVLDDDPGRELGMDRQTGHRFFFGLDEVEVIG